MVCVPWNIADSSGLLSRHDQEHHGLEHGYNSFPQRLIEVVHVGFIDDGEPIVLPMIGKMGQYEGNPMAIYIHGKHSSRS
jgi:hypothetical protein